MLILQLNNEYQKAYYSKMVLLVAICNKQTVVFYYEIVFSIISERTKFFHICPAIYKYTQEPMKKPKVFLWAPVYTITVHCKDE